MEKRLTAEEITECHKGSVPSIPIVGFKRFEPNGSEEELSELRNHFTASGDLVSYQKTRKHGSLSQANWHPQLQKAEVIHQVGSWWSSMGHTIDKKLYLFPEEALYLLETGVLELNYNDVPISVQRAYTLLLDPLTAVTEECYRVYSQLSANGYRVKRHAETNVLTKYEKQLEIHKAGIKLKMSNLTCKRDKPPDCVKYHDKLKKQKTERLCNLFPLSTKDDHEDNLQELKIFKTYKSNELSALNVQYDIYLPSVGKNAFKKAYLQLPKMRVIIHRANDEMPNLKEIHHLRQQFQDEVPVVHAVVFPEFISFYSITPVNTPVCS